MKSYISCHKTYMLDMIFGILETTQFDLEQEQTCYMDHGYLDIFTNLTIITLTILIGMLLTHLRLCST